MTVTERIRDIGIVPVIKLEDPEAAIFVAESLMEGDIPVAEITFRAAGADKAIRTIAENYPDMLVGAGTVLTIEQIDLAVEAGAKFIVSPGFSARNVVYCMEKGIPVFPGCITPSEIERALEYGIKTVKFFPAEQAGGVSMLSALSAPFQEVKFMPTGGISLNNLSEYIKTKNVIACGGSFMVTSALINNKKWDEVTSICKQARSIIRDCRNK